MSNITADYLASVKAAGAKNIQFSPTAENIPSKILIIGTGDPATEATNPIESPYRVFSAEEVGSKTGFGYMLHRLAVQAFKGSNSIETWIIQQAEPGAGVQAAGSIDFAGSTGVLAGTLALYIAGLYVPVTITAGMTADNIATAAAAAITANSDLPVTAVVNGVTTSQIDITCKSEGLFGNYITLDFNIYDTDETPTGVTSAIVAMASGAGTPDIQDALDSLGTGDGANEEHFTHVVHGYLQESGTLNAVSAYVGEGDNFTGLWDKVVHRPFVCFIGDTAAGSAALTALIALGDGRKNDRGNSIISVPDSRNHPAEIAALTCGYVAFTANTDPAKEYQDIFLSGIHPGDKADRWTSEADNRNSAVLAGIGTTEIQSGTVYLRDIITFYHPDTVSNSSNGYRKVRNIFVMANILENTANLFKSSNFTAKSIVSDTARVSDPTAKRNVIDTDTVKDYLVALIRNFEAKAWIYESNFTIEGLKNASSVVIRPANNGFDITLQIILSGTTDIIDGVVEFDPSIAILFAA